VGRPVWTVSALPSTAGTRLSGTWNYVSGISIATHFIGLAAVAGRQRMLLTCPPARIA
jgi:hypothetical protein